jgi:enoyl-CoA hydratase/carnithine racemase/carbon monoxide dehydrogenase subunit G
MEMQGEATVPVSRQRVWDALNNPDVLMASIPGCESMEGTPETGFTATVVSKVGPIKARFVGKVTLSNVVAPKSYTLTGEGSGGAAGFAKADIDVALDSVEADVTRLKYVVRANVGGKLAQLGSRMIDAAARKSADDFFEAFKSEVARISAVAGSSDQPAMALSDLLGESDPFSEVSAPDPDTSTAVDTAPRALVSAATPSQAAPMLAKPGIGSALQSVALAPSVASEAAMDAMANGTIKIWIADQIAVLTLNRPKNRNAMTLDMWRAMQSILSALERNSQVRALILTGAGEDFCSGADIPEFEAVRADAQQAAAYEDAVDACCDAIFNFTKPTIAVLKGYCLGGGAHLAMSCDFRYASEAAVFGIPAGRLSIIYGVRGTRKLLSLVGITQAKKILYGAQRFDAKEALRIGFVDYVAVAGEQANRSIWEKLLRVRTSSSNPDVMAEARSFAQSLAENAPLSMAGAKELLNGMERGTGALDLVDAERLIAQAAGSEDYREGRRAFAEKRKPEFQGR